MPKTLRTHPETPMLKLTLPYVFGLSTVLAGTMMGLMGQPVFGKIPPYLIYILPVMAAAAYGGFAPGLLATGSSAVAIVVVFQAGSIGHALGSTIFLILFGLDGLAISWIGEQMRVSIQTAANAQRQALVARERQERILNSISDAFGALDADLRFTYTNQNLAAAANQAQNELLGKQIWEVFPELAESGPREALRRAFLERVAINFEILVSRLSRWYEISAYPLDAGLSLFCRDMTERKEAERLLQEGEERLRFAPEAAMIGTWTHDLQQNRFLWSRELERIFGLCPGSFAETEQAFFELIHPEDREPVRQAFARAIKEQGLFEVEFRYFHAGGETRWMLGRGSGYFDSSRQPFRLAGVGIDITGQKRSEEKLRHTQRLESLGILAGGVAHDFNNLLVGIMGNASFACQLLPRDHATRRLLQEIVLAGEKAAHLTRQMLAYAGKGHVVIDRLELSALVRDIERLVRSSTPRHVDLQLDLEPDLPAVEGDEGQLQQVLMNLVINAAEAIPAGRAGRVWIRTRSRFVKENVTAPFGSDISAGRYVSVAVEDNGIGMDESTRARIFEPFFTTKFVGRGLGLAAVLGIIRGHKGALTVESTPGKGSKFEVVLPVAQGLESHDDRPAAAGPLDLHGHELLLIVDDESSVRILARSVLETYGYTILLAEDGHAAVELLTNSSVEPSLVLLDLSMPGMSARETIDQLRLRRPDLQFLLSSGYGVTEVTAQLSGEHVLGFIQKPYTAIQLAEKVKFALARANAHSDITNPLPNVLGVVQMPRVMSARIF
jgi:PAS domain S-box-containing protein